MNSVASAALAAYLSVGLLHALSLDLAMRLLTGNRLGLGASRFAATVAAWPLFYKGSRR